MHNEDDKTEASHQPEFLKATPWYLNRTLYVCIALAFVVCFALFAPGIHRDRICSKRSLCASNLAQIARA